MKNSIRILQVLTLAVAGVTALSAAEEKSKSASATKEEKKDLRVITSTTGERRVIVGRAAAGEKEKVTFLGVETSPVSNTVAAQLGLSKGSGLVVNHIVPKSAADGVLEENDILLRFEDQILIETRQLSVLIRNRKEGEEVTLTFLRGGKQTSAKVKLSQKEVPKVTMLFEERIPLGGAGFIYGQSAPDGLPALRELSQGERREDVDRLLALIQPVPGQEPVRIHIDRQGQGYRATSVNTANSSLSFSDDKGSLEVTTKDGKKSVVAKDAKGETLFSGEVNTPEERKAMPEEVRQRLEHLESAHSITFRTDGNFRGAEVKVLEAKPKGISFPVQPLPPPRGPKYL